MARLLLIRCPVNAFCGSIHLITKHICFKVIATPLMSSIPRQICLTHDSHTTATSHSLCNLGSPCNSQARRDAIKVRQEIPALQAELRYEKDELTIARTEAAGLRRELMAALQVCGGLKSHCKHMLAH